jgi:TniQ
MRKAGTKRKGYGMQYCAACLASDRQPYLRLHWRLAFLVQCPMHREMLFDCCAYCHAPLARYWDDVWRPQQTKLQVRRGEEGVARHTLPDEYSMGQNGSSANVHG